MNSSMLFVSRSNKARGLHYARNNTYPAHEPLGSRRNGAAAEEFQPPAQASLLRWRGSAPARCSLRL